MTTSCRYSQSRRQIPPCQWTALDNQTLTSVSPDYVTLVSWLATLAALAVISLVSVISYFKADMPITQLVLLISLLFFIGIGFIIVIHRQAKQLQYGVFAKEFMIRKGLYWRTTIAMPYTRLQHVTLEQNPLERRFSLHRIKCFSAGSGSAEIELPGLESSVAEQLRQHLLKRAAGDPQPHD